MGGRIGEMAQGADRGQAIRRASEWRLVGGVTVGKRGARLVDGARMPTGGLVGGSGHPHSWRVAPVGSVGKNPSGEVFFGRRLARAQAKGRRRGAPGSRHREGRNR